MPLTAQDLMQPVIKTVAPDAPLIELDRAFLEARVGAFPVVAGGELVGIVSRSDIVRQLSVEQSLAELRADADRDEQAYAADAEADLGEIGDYLGRRVEHLRVRDCMTRQVVSATRDTPLPELAALMLQHRVHRLPVVAGRRLVGIVGALDLVRVLAGHGGPAD